MEDNKSSLKHLKTILESFLSTTPPKREDVIKIIREDICKMLFNNEDFNALNDIVPERKIQYRALMWNIILGLGRLDEHEADTYLTAYHYLSNSDQRKLLEEAQRVAKSQRNQKIKTDFQSFCSFLVLFSGFLALNGALYPLEQPLLTFGPVLLQHYSYPVAFFAFRQWVNFYAPNCYQKKGSPKLKPSELAVQIAYDYDPKLKEKFQNLHPEISFSYNHVTSFFTQMKELDQVSIIFDFLFSYGAFMVLFIEAGWMYIHRDSTQLEGAYSLPDACAVIRQAITILKNTKPELITKAKLFYQQR